MGVIMQSQVKLISWTRDPLETIYLLWQASRTQEEISMQHLKFNLLKSPTLRDNVIEIFRKVLQSAIPVSENISFTFLLENVSIAFREQMVRHRVGVKVGDRIGVDIVPDIHDSTWWSQSMRVLDMRDFAERGAYEIPESIDKHLSGKDTFIRAMHYIATAYQILIDSEIPAEDARMVLPLATQHRISWTLNLSTLKHIISKRSCWILQLGLWEPIITGMIEELCRKVDPIFRVLATPPCMSGDNYTGCKFVLDNSNRILGIDPLPPCSIYCHKETNGIPGLHEREDFLLMVDKYKRFWRRDAHTGKMLE